MHSFYPETPEESVPGPTAEQEHRSLEADLSSPAPYASPPVYSNPAEAPPPNELYTSNPASGDLPSSTGEGAASLDISSPSGAGPEGPSYPPPEAEAPFVPYGSSSSELDQQENSPDENIPWKSDGSRFPGEMPDPEMDEFSSQSEESSSSELDQQGNSPDTNIPWKPDGSRFPDEMPDPEMDEFLEQIQQASKDADSVDEEKEEEEESEEEEQRKKQQQPTTQEEVIPKSSARAIVEKLIRDHDRAMAALNAATRPTKLPPDPPDVNPGYDPRKMRWPKAGGGVGGPGGGGGEKTTCPECGKKLDDEGCCPDPFCERGKKCSICGKRVPIITGIMISSPLDIFQCTKCGCLVCTSCGEKPPREGLWYDYTSYDDFFCPICYERTEREIERQYQELSAEK